MSTATLLEQRLTEARVLAEVFYALEQTLGPELAQSAVDMTLERMARQAGEAFAEQARQEGREPSLEHFATILDRWRGTGALDIGEVTLTDRELSFPVTRCRYAEAYREMGLPEQLVRTLSCARDEPFARGYSDRLRLERPETIAAGHPACRFRFVWEK